MVIGALQRLRVLKYIPHKMYGFLVADGSPKQCFFHLRAFHPGSPQAATCCQATPCEWILHPPPPIIGEAVEAVLEVDPTHPENLRASSAKRVEPAVPLAGTIESFDVHRGYGFLRGPEGLDYYLHRSEILEGRIPIVGQRAVFFTAERKAKARACHVKICPTE
jgi:cold shock CspA family protein